MARYRFHCTNGSECFFDARGTDIRVPARLAMRAQQVARVVMRTVEDTADWSAQYRIALALARQASTPAQTDPTRSCCLCRHHHHPPADHVRFKRCLSEPWSAPDWRIAVCDLKGRRVLVQPFGSDGE